MYSYRILQNYSKDMFHCSILRFDKGSYLFNCCDGTQRNALEQGIKFTKIKSIFFNSSSIDSYLGCYGFLMSRGEMNFSRAYQIAKNMEIDMNIKNDKKIFDIHKENKVSKPILNQNKENNNIFSDIQQCLLFGPPTFTQNFIKTQDFCPVPINKHLYEYDPINSSFICKNIFKEKINSKPMQIYQDDTISIIPICYEHSMSYICIPKRKNRTFNKQKALEFGLKPGPIYGKLTRGEAVTLENGKVITLNDVSEEPLPSSSLTILYIPNESSIDNIIKNDIINKYINHGLGEKYVYNINIVVHICPKFSFINNEKYYKFMASFGKDVEHIIECPEINQQFMYNEGKIKIQYLLNKVSNILFPDMIFSENETKSNLDNKEEIFMNINKSYGLNIDESIPGREYIIYPPEKKEFVIKGLYQGNAYYFNSEDYQNFIKNISDIKINNINNIITSYKEKLNLNPNSPRVTFLGTSSMKPGKFRNVSAILIQNTVNSIKKYILFDCGEGTFQQMYEKFGSDITSNILLNINLIAISHKHGDHMLGLMKIIKEIDKLLIIKNFDRNKIIEEKIYIYIIVPKTIIDFVKNSINLDIEYKEYFKIYDCNFFNVNEVQYYKQNLLQDNPNENFNDIAQMSPINDYNNLCIKINNFRSKPELKFIYEDFLSKLGILFNTIEVFHCEESFGFFIENNLNKEDPLYFKISFSGDTRPNNNFFNYSMHSTLFIHEGTFDDDMTIDAEEKMHSTVGQAISIGEQNMSKFIAITHFSPRYIKTYPFKEDLNDKKILLTNDYLSFTLDELPVAYNYLKSFDEVINNIEGCKKKKNIL